MSIPFDFILDHLDSGKVSIKPMFGCFRLYMDHTMYFFLRDRKDQKELNGVWIAVASQADYESLADELPSIHREYRLHPTKKSINKWLLLSCYDENFESLVINTCALIRANDKRIGKITKGSLSQE